MTRKTHLRIGSLIAAVGCTILLNWLPVSGQPISIESEIAAVEFSMAEGMGAHLDLIAPEAFKDAQDRLSKAKERFKKGGKIEEIRKELAEARAKLQEAAQLKEMGKLLLEDALIAREGAIEAKASEFAPQEWDKAKEAMHDAGREVEKGRQNEARSKATKAEKLFRAAELQAIRTDLLGQAKTMRSRALEAGAEDKASRTFALANQELHQAEKVLQGDRYQRVEAKNLARQAALDFEHARLIATYVDLVDEKNDGEVEKLQLAHEAAVGKIAEAFSLDTDFSRGLTPVTEALVSATNSLLADRADLQAHLINRELQLVVAVARIDSMDAALASLENRERTTNAMLRGERNRQANLKSVAALFGSDEATVLLEGDDLIIRLYSLSFQVGSTEIQPKDFQLLTQLQSALRTFPGAPVQIGGHTDATGDDQSNQALSLKRAEAVRSYLMANMGGDEARLSAVGFGETVPLSSNETLEGRARNRRIDVRIDTAMR